MPFYGDPAAMDAAAARLAGRADDIRAHAARVRRQVEGIDWHSTAANSFKAVAETDLHRLLAAAEELADAADALRVHAATVRRRLDEIATIERQVRHWFVQRGSEIASAAATAMRVADTVGDTIGGLLTNPFGTARRMLQEEPWKHWPWRPDRLPAPGDIAWFEVASDLRRRGVPV